MPDEQRVVATTIVTLPFNLCYETCGTAADPSGGLFAVTLAGKAAVVCYEPEADLIAETHAKTRRREGTTGKIHAKQLLTYLRPLDLPLGLLVNFGAATFKEGIKRVVNGHTDFAFSRLRVNQESGPANTAAPSTRPSAESEERAASGSHSRT